MRLVQQLEGAYVRRMRRAVPKPGRPCTICGQAKRLRIVATVTAGTSMTLGGSVGGERAGEHLHQPRWWGAVAGAAIGRAVLGVRRGRLAGRVTTEVGVAASYARR